jgi:flagellin
MLQKSLNRLSSGSKIVSPADDAGGLAVSMKLSAAAKRQGAVSNNVANAVSLLQAQDGVLGATGKILNRSANSRCCMATSPRAVPTRQTIKAKPPATSSPSGSSRLGFASDLLSVNKANLEAANRRIVDVATESTVLARYNVLVQAGTAMLSQANQSSQMALKLLG